MTVTTEIIDRLNRLGVRQRDVAERLEIGQDKVSKVYSGIRQWKGPEVAVLLEWLQELEDCASIITTPDVPEGDTERLYLPVEVLPSYAGMGGGGNGDGEPEIALISRALIEDQLRARPKDLLVIDVRGDSMMPDFQHGDQILIDRRDVDPVQPGPFCLWDGDGYVVKLVERVPQQRGFYRIFSANGRYSSYEVDAGDVRIMGRPVWFARRL